MFFVSLLSLHIFFSFRHVQSFSIATTKKTYTFIHHTTSVQTPTPTPTPTCPFQSKSLLDSLHVVPSYSWYTCLQNSKNSDHENETQIQLILGEEVSKTIAGLGSEGGYLAAAKKRAEEAKKKRLEQTDHRQEQQDTQHQPTAHIKHDSDNTSSTHNYGPADLSGWRGFRNDGFEASAGNDGQDGWDVRGGILTVDKDGKMKKSQTEEKTQEDKSERKLFLFGDDSMNDGKILF